MSPFAKSFSHQDVSSRPRNVMAWAKQHVSLLNILSFAMLCAMSIIYIVHVNHSVSQGYQLHTLESQISDLSLQNQSLEITMQKAESLQTVSRAIKMIGLVEAEQPTYVVMKAPAFAMATR